MYIASSAKQFDKCVSMTEITATKCVADYEFKVTWLPCLAEVLGGPIPIFTIPIILQSYVFFGSFVFVVLHFLVKRRMTIQPDFLQTFFSFIIKAKLHT